MILLEVKKMIYGYARVSTKKQDLSTQISDLKKAGAEKIFAEKWTGTSMNRPQFEKLLDIVKVGDTVLVTKLDRLARNTQDALEIATTLRDKKVVLDVLNMGPINNTPMGQLIFAMFSAFAQFERDLIVARTQEGKEWAKKHKPNYLDGRPRKFDSLRIEHAYQLRKQGYSYSQLEEMLGISRATLCRRIQEYKATHEEDNNHDTN